MTTHASARQSYDLVCFSHLRWNGAVRRPRHLLTRCAASRRVYYIEEPVFHDGAAPSLQTIGHDGVLVATPYLPQRCRSARDVHAALRHLVDDLFARERIEHFVAWYYTPMALTFTRHLTPDATVLDCTEERSDNETELLARADVVFAAGRGLFEAKRHLHRNVHEIPGSVDTAHFRQARDATHEPGDQAAVARPRLGYAGVIDERIDLDLLAAVADARPEWQLVMVGPVERIDQAALPRRANIHYLGGKSYTELPHYIAFWNVALLPFARTDATRLLSPAETPEYLAAAKPVVATSIRDVVRSYERKGLARIADAPADFVAACEAAMGGDPLERMARTDAFLTTTSWDRTWSRMQRLLDAALDARRDHAGAPPPITPYSKIAGAARRALATVAVG